MDDPTTIGLATLVGTALFGAGGLVSKLFDRGKAVSDNESKAREELWKELAHARTHAEQMRVRMDDLLLKEHGHLRRIGVLETVNESLIAKSKDAEADRAALEEERDKALAALDAQREQHEKRMDALTAEIDRWRARYAHLEEATGRFNAQPPRPPKKERP